MRLEDPSKGGRGIQFRKPHSRRENYGFEPLFCRAKSWPAYGRRCSKRKKPAIGRLHLLTF
jgi:hypothetical protein